MAHVTRRRILTVGTISLGVFVAGCSSSEDTSNGETDEEDGASDEGDSSTDGSDGETHSVEMTGELAFEPDSITIQPGDTVVWENVSNADHTVTAQDDIPAGAAYFASVGFDSEGAANEAYSSDQEGAVAPRDTYEHTFTVEGTYKYYCIPHENQGMGGRVIVREG